MTTVAIIIAIIDIIICIGLVTMVVFQEGSSKGLGIIGGGAETFFGKAKGRSIDAVLKKLTSVAAIVFAILTIVLYLITGRGN
jgi:preprotein translocase subunit SecG